MSSGSTGSPSVTARPRSPEWAWGAWPLLPVYPYGQRRTHRREVVKDTIWTFEQLHGLLYAIVPIRMTVIRLEAGGLLVYAPVASTPECVRLVRELEAIHGSVQVILLPTSSGLEHKVFVAPFARHFPQAQVLVAPHPWSFPLNLPLPWLGFPPHRTQVIDPSHNPFPSEFDMAVLDIDLGRGAFSEVALLHRPTRTLLLTDLLVSIPPDPPPLLQMDPYPLLFHAREQATDPLTDSEATRRKGWQRICLFAMYFRPGAVETVGIPEMIRASLGSPDRSRRAYFGWFPFRWSPDWETSFHQLRREGRPLVAPILQRLILPQDPAQTQAWVNQVAGWDFDQIIPCHLDAPIAAGPELFRQAFAFLDTQDPGLPSQDLVFMEQLESTLVRRNIAKRPRTTPLEPMQQA